jgi:hypothetical protein
VDERDVAIGSLYRPFLDLAREHGVDVDAVLTGNGGSSRPLVSGINAAENLLFTTSGRLFVIGDDGIFEIVQAGMSYRSLARHTGESCHVGGIVEVSSTLYANCYDMDKTISNLFAAQLNAEPAVPFDS